MLMFIVQPCEILIWFLHSFFGQIFSMLWNLIQFPIHSLIFKPRSIVSHIKFLYHINAHHHTHNTKRSDPIYVGTFSILPFGIRSISIVPSSLRSQYKTLMRIIHFIIRLSWYIYKMLSVFVRCRLSPGTYMPMFMSTKTNGLQLWL